MAEKILAHCRLYGKYNGLPASEREILHRWVKERFDIGTVKSWYWRPFLYRVQSEIGAVTTIA